MKVTRQKRLRSHFRQLLHKSLRSRESILSYTRKIRLQTDRLRDFTQSLLHSCEAITNVDKNFVDEDIEIYRHMADSSSDDTFDTAAPRDTRDNAPPNDQDCEPSSSQTLTTGQTKHGVTAARHAAASRDARTANWTGSVIDPIVISDDNLERNPPTPFSLSELLGAPLRPPGSPAVRLDRTQADRTIENDQVPPEELSDEV